MVIRFALVCVLLIHVGCTSSSPPIPQDALTPQTSPLELARQELNAADTPPHRKLALSVQVGQMLQAAEQSSSDALTYYKQGASIWEQYNVGWESREDFSDLGMLGARAYFELAQDARKRAQAVSLDASTQMSALKRAFGQRTTFILAADKLYARAAILSSLHGERSILRAQSLYEMARQYDEFAILLTNTSAPDKLSAEQQQVFEGILREYAVPLFERAQKHYILVTRVPVESQEGRAVVSRAQARLDAMSAQ